MAQSVFERSEQKYLLDSQQYAGLLSELEKTMTVDEYGETTICNIYYDTDDYRLIRESIDKPVYKEKLRVRTYGVPKAESRAFIELKKKYEGVVYKRRVAMKYADAMQFLSTGQYDSAMLDAKSPNAGQIAEEIRWVLKFYRELKPKLVLCYDRVAFLGKEDPNVRLTIDKQIRYREKDMDLTLGDEGDALYEEPHYLLEIKITDRMPDYLIEAFRKLRIYPVSFSKYGRIYEKLHK